MENGDRKVYIMILCKSEREGIFIGVFFAIIDYTFAKNMTIKMCLIRIFLSDTPNGSAFAIPIAPLKFFPCLTLSVS
jgi:hypothetical protein